VPCIESPQAVEGEAYAAALVRHGRADYVASEDTVSSFVTVK
jgi:XPG I-region